MTTVIAVERLRNTPSGNPVYRVYFDGDRTFVTEPDSQVAHLIPNIPLGVPVTYTVDDGRLTSIEVEA